MVAGRQGAAQLVCGEAVQAAGGLPALVAQAWSQRVVRWGKARQGLVCS